MNEQQEQPQSPPTHRDTTTNEDVPTAVETGRSPRPSQAEGDRETVEEDLEEQA
jgi:hypothetical protein